MDLPTKFVIWCRRTDDPNALWSSMPFHKRSKQECDALVEYYEEEWGSLYDYEVVLAGFAPQGVREPEFV